MQCDAGREIVVFSESEATAECLSQELMTIGLLPRVVLGIVHEIGALNLRQVRGSIIATARISPEVAALAKALRAAAPGGFVLAVLAARSEAEELLGLDAGIDQTLLSPVSSVLFRRRVLTLLERFSAGYGVVDAAHPVRSLGELHIDLNVGRVSCEGKEVRLTPSERSVLDLLTRSPGRPVTRAAIANSLWGWNSAAYEGYIKCHVSRIRTKLRLLCGVDLIRTVRGKGYWVVDTKEKGASSRVSTRADRRATSRPSPVPAIRPNSP